MTDEKTQLEVGDELVHRSGFRGDVLTIYKVERVTNTMAFSGMRKYRRSLEKSWHSDGLQAKVIGESYSYDQLATPELKKERAASIRRRKAEAAFRDIKTSGLTTEQLEQIVEIAAQQATQP